MGEPIDKDPWGELEPEEGEVYSLNLYLPALTALSVHRGIRGRIRRRGGGGRGG